jgi:putative hydrolase of the HAD superfamily
MSSLSPSEGSLTTSGFRAVVFDFFGTLTHAVRRGPAHAHIARWLGCDPAALTAALDRSFAARARGGLGPPAKALRRVIESAGAHPSEDRLAAVRADTRVRPEAGPVLAALRGMGLRTALISDCCHELPQFLPTLPIAGLLDTCVYSIDLGVCKPDPEMYLTACRRLAVSPEQCLYVGDGGSRELSGARAVGMTAVRLAAPDLATHLSFNAEAGWSGPTIHSLTEVPSLLAPAREPALVGYSEGGW